MQMKVSLLENRLNQAANLTKVLWMGWDGLMDVKFLGGACFGVVKMVTKKRCEK